MKNQEPTEKKCCSNCACDASCSHSGPPAGPPVCHNEGCTCHLPSPKTGRCCPKFFIPSRDELRPPEYMISEAMPEGCNNENCNCHATCCYCDPHDGCVLTTTGKCICGALQARNIIHRKDGPCYYLNPSPESRTLDDLRSTLTALVARVRGERDNRLPPEIIDGLKKEGALAVLADLEGKFPNKWPKKTPSFQMGYDDALSKVRTVIASLRASIEGKI